MAFTQLGEVPNALERLSVAALAPDYRAAALVRIARLYCAQGEYAKCLESATRVLESNPLELSALHLRVVGLRLCGREGEHLRECRALLQRFPLYHPLRYELEGTEFVRQIRCELPKEELLECATLYAQAGLYAEAIEIVALIERSALALLFLST